MTPNRMPGLGLMRYFPSASARPGTETIDPKSCWLAQMASLAWGAGWPVSSYVMTPSKSWNWGKRKHRFLASLDVLNQSAVRSVTLTTLLRHTRVQRDVLRSKTIASDNVEKYAVPRRNTT